MLLDYLLQMDILANAEKKELVFLNWSFQIFASY